MNRHALFPDYWRPGQDERAERSWDLSWPLPIPGSRLLSCVQCAGRTALKDWKFHRRDTGSERPWRCDVRLKCMSCAQVTIHGVVVPEAMYLNAVARLRSRTRGLIEWRVGREILSDAGFFGQ